MEILERLNDQLAPNVDAHQDQEVAFTYRPTRTAVLQRIQVPTGRRDPGMATVTLTVREDDDGGPGRLLAESSLLVTRFNWYDFTLPHPVPVTPGRRYWLGIVGNTGWEEAPLLESEAGQVVRAMESQYMYVLPARQSGGVPLDYFVLWSDGWRGPYLKCFIARTLGIAV